MMIKNYQLGLLATKRLAGRKLKGDLQTINPDQSPAQGALSSLSKP